MADDERDGGIGEHLFLRCRGIALCAAGLVENSLQKKQDKEHHERQRDHGDGFAARHQLRQHRQLGLTRADLMRDLIAKTTMLEIARKYEAMAELAGRRDAIRHVRD